MGEAQSYCSLACHVSLILIGDLAIPAWNSGRTELESGRGRIGGGETGWKGWGGGRLQQNKHNRKQAQSSSTSLEGTP